MEENTEVTVDDLQEAGWKIPKNEGPAEPLDQDEPPVVEQEGEEQEEQEEIAPKKNGLDKRFSKLTKQRADAQAAAQRASEEAAYWREQALGKQAPAQAQTESDKPRLEQYGGNVEAFTEDLTEWKLYQREVKQHEAQVKHAQVSVVKQYEARAADFTTVAPDFYEVLSDAADVDACHELLNYCLTSDVGPAMSYYFAKNVEEVERINSLPPRRRDAELGKIEGRIEERSKKPVTVKKNIAPPPITPNKGGKPPSKEKSIYEMSPNELMRHRNKMEFGN